VRVPVPVPAPVPDRIDVFAPNVEPGTGTHTGTGTKSSRSAKPAAMRRELWLVPIVLLVGVGAYLAFQVERAQTPWIFVFAGLPTVALAGIGAFRAHKDGQLKRWLSPSWGDFTRGFAGATFLFLVVLVATKLFFNGPPRDMFLIRLYTQLGSPSELQQHAVPVALALAVVAAAEEVLWRGFVTTLVAERIGTRWAWVVAAGLYALAHVPTMFALEIGGTPNPVLPLAALAGGLLWGAMTRFFGRLPPSILAHALFDWCVVMMFPLWSLAPAAA
jgi:membrane protease YdiL (CAAX protease family)